LRAPPELSSESSARLPIDVIPTSGVHITSPMLRLWPSSLQEQPHMPGALASTMPHVPDIAAEVQVKDVREAGSQCMGSGLVHVD
jgi:hypothetical protein